MARTFLLAIGLVAVGPGGQIASAVVVSPILTLTPPSASANRFDLGVSAEVFLAGTLTDSATTDLSGTANAQLELTLLSQGVLLTGIRFEGGSIGASDVELSLASLGISSTNLGGELFTVGTGFSPVSGATFSADDHGMVLNSGTIDYPGGALDFGQSPLEIPGIPGQSGMISLVQFPSEGSLRTYGVTATLPVSVAATEPVDEPLIVGGGIDYSLMGSLSLVGEFTVELPAAGDFNVDGVVDAADYAAWRNGGSPGGGTLADYDLWRANFGSTGPSQQAEQSAVVTVPAPGGGILLAILAYLAGFGGRTARRVGRSY